MQEQISRPIEITVNGEATHAESLTLAALLHELGYGEAKVATALNGEFVPASARTHARLAKSDNVEIVAPRQGG